MNLTNEGPAIPPPSAILVKSLICNPDLPAFAKYSVENSHELQHSQGQERFKEPHNLSRLSVEELVKEPVIYRTICC